MAWATLGSWECPSSSAVTPRPWAASSAARTDFRCKTDPGPQQNTLGIKHLFGETYENQGSSACVLLVLREGGGVFA